MDRALNAKLVNFNVLFLEDIFCVIPLYTIVILLFHEL